MVTGPMVRAFENAARKTYDAIPDPKIVVATGERDAAVSPLPFMAGAAAAWGLATIIALTCGSTRVGIRACCAVSALLSGNSRVVSAGGSVVVGTLQVQATSLAGVFIALLGVIAVATAAYVPRYHEPGHATGLYLGVFNLAALASLVVLAAGNVVTFLVAWETMALLCYLLILRRPRRPEVAAGAFWFLAEVGFVAIVAAFVILAAKTHTMQLDLIAARAHLVSGDWRVAAYLLALTGFGFKAGLVPLHVWLPEAHPVAPADGSAFLSGLITKLGCTGSRCSGSCCCPTARPGGAFSPWASARSPRRSGSCTRSANATSSGSWPSPRSRTSASLSPRSAPG